MKLTPSLRIDSRAVQYCYKTILAVMLSLLAHSFAWADQPLAKIEGDLPSDLKELVEQVLGEVETPPRSLAQARRRAQTAADQATSVLRSQGYYSGEINAGVEEPYVDVKKTPSPQPILNIEPGEQFKFSDINVTYEGGAPDITQRVNEVVGLKSGAAALADRVVAAELRIINLLRANGYPEARALPRKAVVDHDSKTMRVTYNVSAGEKTLFGTIKQTGTAKIVESWPPMVAPFKEGELFDDRKLNRLAARVIGTGVFDGATATLADEKIPNGDGTITRNVMLNVEQGAVNTVSGAIGYSTTDGSGVELAYERRNFIGYAQTLKLLGTAKTNEISAGVAYNIPYAWRADRELDLAAEIARENTDAFEGERIGTNALLTQKMSQLLKISAGVSFEASRFKENGVDVNAYLVEGLLKASFDNRDNIFDPERGYYVEADLTPTYNFGGSEGLFTNGEVSVSTYERLSEQIVIAGRVKLGTIFGAQQSAVPLNRRYYGGGGGSVRGFGYQSISPRNADGDLIGGRSISEVSAELRYRLAESNLGFVGFVDAGSVTVQDLPTGEDIRYGAGLGVRYYTSFAPLRADIAIPINKRDGDNAVQIYISIGQAF